MRLFVVASSPPLISRRCWPYSSTAAQPPGPGFPSQAPSEWIVTDLRGIEVGLSTAKCARVTATNRAEGNEPARANAERRSRGVDPPPVDAVTARRSGAAANRAGPCARE